MLKLVLAGALAGVALAVYFLGREALLMVVGIGLGIGFAELVDLGVRLAAPRDALTSDEDMAPHSRR